jgi:hypothetical protein
VGEKTRTAANGDPCKAWDHDPPAKEKLVPFGFLFIGVGLLVLIFGRIETSDAWADALKLCWTRVKHKFPHVTRLIFYLDNGPHNNGHRTQFLKRMIEFADWSGLEVRLIYYPPYHSKYNPVERCWSSLERKFSGVLLVSIRVIFSCARRMTWRKTHPRVYELHGNYQQGVKLTKAEMASLEPRLQRSKSLPKYDITIKPLPQKQIT